VRGIRALATTSRAPAALMTRKEWMAVSLKLWPERVGTLIRRFIPPDIQRT